MTYKSVVLADSPSVLWMLNEASGTTAADATGNGHTGTYDLAGITLGQTSLIPSDPTDTSVLCSGAGGHYPMVFASNTPPQVGTSAWSLEAVIKTPTLPTSAGEWILVCGSAGGSGGYAITISDTGNGGSHLVCLLVGVAWGSNPSTPLVSATAYHVVYAYSSAAGGTGITYINGSVVQTQTGLGTPNAPA